MEKKIVKVSAKTPTGQEKTAEVELNGFIDKLTGMLSFSAEELVKADKVKAKIACVMLPDEAKAIRQALAKNDSRIDESCARIDDLNHLPHGTWKSIESGLKIASPEFTAMARPLAGLSYFTWNDAGLKIAKKCMHSAYAQYGYGSWIVTDKELLNEVGIESLEVYCSDLIMRNMTNAQIEDGYQKTKDYDGNECRLNVFINGLCVSFNFSLFGLDTSFNADKLVYSNGRYAPKPEKLIAAIKAVTTWFCHHVIEEISEDFCLIAEKCIADIILAALAIESGSKRALEILSASHDLLEAENE